MLHQNDGFDRSRGSRYQRQGLEQEAESAWLGDLATVEAVAGGDEETRFRAARARALLYLGRLQEARPIVQALADRGYGKSDLIEPARLRGLLR